MQQFIEFVTRHCPSDDIVPVLIAHNGKDFDVPLLANVFKREGLQMPPTWHFMDTLPVARRAISRDSIPNYKLVGSLPRHQ